MSEVTPNLVRELRDRTGAGMMDCKRALTHVEGDVDKAIVVLREKGLAAAAKRAGRVASEGAIFSYIHAGGKIGVLLEVNCETDFVARTDAFRALARDVAMQVAAMEPLALTEEDVPEDAPGERSAHALLSQEFIKDSGKTVQDLVQELMSHTGENVRITRFSRSESS